MRSLSQHHLIESDPSEFDDPPMPLWFQAAPGEATSGGGLPTSSYRMMQPPCTHSVGSLRCSPNESAVRHLRRKITKNSMDSSGNYYRITTKRNYSFESIEKEHSVTSNNSSSNNNPQGPNNNFNARKTPSSSDTNGALNVAETATTSRTKATTIRLPMAHTPVESQNSSAIKLRKTTSDTS